ncbi:MAG TPA: hypothetical protein GX713_01500, partial [Mollicutes bacterium]|nr:hypothetical protein [Mollicutes bacterium]
MKKLSKIIIAIILFFSLKISIKAAPSASLTVSRTTITNGESVTAYINLRNAAAWEVTITGTGNTKGCSQIFADATTSAKNSNKTLSITCRSTDVGIINFSLSGNVTDEKDSEVNVRDNIVVSVVKPAPVAPKSTNNYLKSLSIEGASLTPKFNKSTLEYSVELEPKTEKIKISAQLEDSKSSLKGTGTITVSE